MLKTYRCIYPNHQIVVKPAIAAKGNDRGQKGEYIQFMNGTYKTDNEEYQKILESNILFGAKLFVEEEEEIEAKRGRGNPNFGKKNNE